MGARGNEEDEEGSNNPDLKKESKQTMKKLMIASLAAVAVGGVFATPVAYDYKASVKHMYEKLQSGNPDVYVKYVKSSKLQGYFVQDFDGTSKLANILPDGTAVQTEKRGFLVLINKSAEKDYRVPKIMPAQIDVKACITKAKNKSGKTTSTYVYEAYFYAGPFAGLTDPNKWNPEQDDNKDYLFNNASGGAPGVDIRTYGTAGSTLYLFGQHNTFNRFNNSANHDTWSDGKIKFDTTGGPSGNMQAEVRAFGDAWLNGAGFGTGTSKSTLCCGWATLGNGNNIFKTLSGNLKGGLFLCGIGNRPANTAAGYFALGLEDVFKSDIAGTLAKQVQGDQIAAPLEDDPADYVTWADGDIALSTTDVVSGSWSLKPSTKLQPVGLDAAEIAFFAGTSAPATSSQELLEYIKGANRALLKSYKLTTWDEARGRNGKNTTGLITAEFCSMFL